MLVFGTRPEGIKMCPLVKEFQKCPGEFETIVCVTWQHREMLTGMRDVLEGVRLCRQIPLRRLGWLA